MSGLSVLRYHKGASIRRVRRRPRPPRRSPAKRGDFALLRLARKKVAPRVDRVLRRSS
ncbi:Hypothetical protein A7982_02956 [Minicystis rosea]|nr:Hypothetical protein A7982_02956 [Minicystis rosea]